MTRIYVQFNINDSYPLEDHTGIVGPEFLNYSMILICEKMEFEV